MATNANMTSTNAPNDTPVATSSTTATSGDKNEDAKELKMNNNVDDNMTNQASIKRKGILINDNDDDVTIYKIKNNQLHVSFPDSNDLEQIHIIPSLTESQILELFYTEEQILRFQYESNLESTEDYIFS